MANLVSCPACGSRLSLGQLPHPAYVKCRRCGGKVATGAAPAAAAPPPPPELQRRLAPAPALPPPTVVIAEEIPDAELAPPRRRKKKRRRYHDEDQPAGKPAWFWLLMVGSGLVTLIGMGIGLYFILTSEKGFDIALFGLEMAICVPISVVIFIASIFISNALGIGIDLGAAHTAIIKAAVLLLTVNIVDRVPLPYSSLWLTLPTWIIGLMLLFQMDMWEARFIVVINWCIMFVIKLFLLGIFIAAIRGGGIKETNTDFDEFPRDPRKGRIADPFGEPDEGEMQEEALERGRQEAISLIRKLGGQMERDPNEDRFIAIVHLDNTRLTDADLAKLTALHGEIKHMDISGTQVTDRGIVHLEKLQQLKHLYIGNTRITENGIRRLKQAIPEITIYRHGRNENTNK